MNTIVMFLLNYFIMLTAVVIVAAACLGLWIFIMRSFCECVADKRRD
jgi:hypothetical protein